MQHTSFFERPILNSPYAYPARYWELDADHQPTGNVVERRRPADFLTPIPKPKKRKVAAAQGRLITKDEAGLSTAKQEYALSEIINEVRRHVDAWRALPNPRDWHVTPETERLVQHWRHYPFTEARPFFCQVEAVETTIWLTEVAPGLEAGKRLLSHLEAANAAANPELSRLALKLATGTGKTTVMAMLIAWQTINAVRYRNSNKFTRGFLVVTPGLTIKDRLRVLQPNDPDSYYRERELVPPDLLPELGKAKIVITNFHAFKLREELELAKGTRALLEGHGPPIQSLETEGQMLQRVMPELMAMKNILVFNDEAHHCYRHKVAEESEEEDLTAEDRAEAETNNENARLWISGLEMINRTVGLHRVIDLSATPFFLRGSGYAEGTLFPWTMCDFSLMDAIECGIVKLPRVPVVDNTEGVMPKYRDLWVNLKGQPGLPRAGRAKTTNLDPLAIPPLLKTALEALYGHYAKTFDLWKQEGIPAPPCFIIVCNNTATSKLVYDYVAGFERKNPDGSRAWFEHGRLALFRNYDEAGNRLPRPNTLLIDSEQLESGEGLDPQFRQMAADEIERFRREVVERTGNAHAADDLSDNELLREVMNTVGKVDRLGGSIRCVVSVSMLSEGWDANTVTHVLGVRAFGTQLLCEQVIGRALRRQSYKLNPDNLFDVEYADVLGVPFDFTAKPTVAPPQPPTDTVQVKAVRPDRDALEIRFPRVVGYRVDLGEERLEPKFTKDSNFTLTPALIGPSRTENAGIIGESINLNLAHTEAVRRNTIVYNLTKHMLEKWREPGEEPRLHLFGQLKQITADWLDHHFTCVPGTYPAQLLYLDLAEMACQRIQDAITRNYEDDHRIKVLLDPHNPTGSTNHVRFNTSANQRWQTDPRKCHVNWIVYDSDWEAELCRVAEAHSRVLAYVKNHALGFEVPYRYLGESRLYRPDFIVQVNDGQPDPLNLVVEIKGYRGEDAKDKKSAIETYWLPGVNGLGSYGRWAFAEFTDYFNIESAFDQMLKNAIAKSAPPVES